MAWKVIKCKEITQNTQILKIDLISLYILGSRPQKSPKIAQTGRFIVICSIFWIGMVYIRWYLVNPHVERVQNMYGKGGCRGCLRPSYRWPKFTLVSRFVVTDLRCQESKTISWNLVIWSSMKKLYLHHMSLCLPKKCHMRARRGGLGGGGGGWNAIGINVIWFPIPLTRGIVGKE